MYLSRLMLNPRSRRVQREIAEPYQMHRTLMRSFPDDLDRERERVLFRLDAEPRSGALILLVQSTLEPRWGWLENSGARDYLLPAQRLPAGVHDNPATKPVDLHLAGGQVLAFRLRANPTVKRRFDDGQHKRVGLYGEEEQIEWLKRKGQQGGFRLLSARANSQDLVKGSMGRGKAGYKLLAVQFDGLLQVTDPGRLRETVRRGIGSAKGFGFGLLSLARPQGI